jgi:choline dehydrogenase-like flavoprotein
MAATKLKADVVVVGSGPGGSTVARDLTLKGKKVILLEWGYDNRPTGTMMGASRYMGGLSGFGKGMILTPEMTMIIRCITLGGTTLMYLGSAYEPKHDTFQKYGVDLPKEETEKIKKELRIQPMPDEFLGEGAKAIMKSARELGYDWQKILKFVDPAKGRPSVKDFYFGSKNGAKWQAREWALDAKQKGAKLMCGTLCEEVIIENGKATGVMALEEATGRQYEISADKVVLSAGGVGSPTILQRTGIYEAGKNFFFDPFVIALGYLDKRLKWETPMCAGVHIPEHGCFITDMSTPWCMYAYFTALGMKPFKMLKTRGLVGLMIKAADTLDGEITVAGGVVKSLSKQDHFRLNVGRSVSWKILKNAGCSDIWFSPIGAAHPGGTCRIGEIVNSDLETKYKNLFVVDGSVIPEPWGLPPVLTIICLARRLSKHLCP